MVQWAKRHARGHGLGQSDHDNLSVGLRQAVEVLVYMLERAGPKIVPLSSFPSASSAAVIFTDAFYKPGEVGKGHGKSAPAPVNGWGFVAKTPFGTFFSHGSLSPQFTKLFCTRKAYIYMMEVIAVLFAVMSLRQVLPQLVTFYIDNQSGKFALTKGYGKNPEVNLIITCFWLVMEAHHFHPHFQYVKSGLNISDPVSRGDFEHPLKEGWQWLECPVDDIVQVLTRALATNSFDFDGLRENLMNIPTFTPCSVGGASAVWLKGTTGTNGST